MDQSQEFKETPKMADKFPQIPPESLGESSAGKFQNDSNRRNMCAIHIGLSISSYINIYICIYSHHLQPGHLI